MKETSQQDINKKRKFVSSSIYSITEKQDESSESNRESKYGKQIITDNSNNIFMRDTIIDNKSIPSKRFINKKKSSKSFNKIIGDKDNNYMNSSEQSKNYLKENLKRISRKISLLSLNSGSEQNESNNTNNKMIHVKSTEHISQKRNSNQKKMSLFQLFKITNIKRKKSVNISPINAIKKKFNQKTHFNNTISSNAILRKSSFNYSSSTSFLKNSSSKRLYKKESLFGNRRAKIHNENNKILSINLFEKLKNSPLFEKSEKILKKEKYLYGVLGFFTLMSILFQTLDTFVYNQKSIKYLEEKHKLPIYFQNEKFYYQLMEKRLISKEENCLRTFNFIFSLISVLLVLRIYYIKKQFVRQSNKNNKNFFNKYFGNKIRKNKNIKEDGHIKIWPDADDAIPKKRLSKNELIITILNCIINLIFYPPLLNKVFIKKNGQIINVYSLNSIILMFSFLKLINFYRVIVYISPLNKIINKAICKEKMVKMDFMFMLRYFLNRYPMTFILSSFILLSISYCILIFCVDFFSLDIINGFWNNKGDNNLRNIYNCIYLFVFYIYKNNSGDIKPESPLGIFIMICGGTFGLFIFSYFLYYINNLIELTTEEQKAISKIDKILNPLNKEHKSANLIKVLFLIKKMLKDYKNIEKDYKKIKREKSFYETLRRNYDFTENVINNSFSSLIENSIYIEQTNFFKYIYNKYILKIKIITECKNLKNRFLIARNYSHSFTDLLKTLGHKMDENLNQLNSKIQLIISKEKKYSNFKKNHRTTSRKIKRVLNYQKSIIDYLININNTDNYEEYLNNVKEMKKRGNLIGVLLNCHRKLVKNKMKKVYNKLGYSFIQKKTELKKLDSSIFETGQSLNRNKNILKKSTLEFDSYNFFDNINKTRKIKIKSKSLNSHFKSKNNLMKKTFIHSNENSNNKINIKSKRKNSCISNKDDVISKIISNNL